MDSSLISGLVLGAASLVAFLASQASAKGREQREELRRNRRQRRHMQNQLELHERYKFRLEQALAKYDLPLPDKPPGWAEGMKEYSEGEEP